MAPPSPRRSSRARATNSQSQQSSGASSTSGRLERNTRSINKPSSTKSTPTASLSSEPLEDLDDTLLGRRRKRGQDDEIDKTSRLDLLDMPNGSDDLQEEDEAVRCICGSEDYPGRPPVDGPDAEFFASIEMTEEVTGFFVQCDVCKVWQHGACVGIFSAESSPDEYFCEQCRKDLHKIHIASNGQKYSKYVPLHRPSRSTSRADSIAKEGARSPKPSGSKSSRPTSASQAAAAAKRRSTMNSRDRAYDDEQLLRAIEASKEDAPLDNPEGIIRRAKRGRSDSEESIAVDSQPQGEKLISLRNIPSIKRQRTSSQSPSPAVKPAEIASHEESDEDSSIRNGAKKPRNGKIQRERTDKEDKEDKERQRQEAASKRKGRAERRRGEDSDPSEEASIITAKPPATKSAEPPTPAEPPAAPEPTPDPPPTSHPPPASSHKRGGRGHYKRGKGRNQYTRDRDGDHSHSPARSMSRDVQRNGDESATTGHSKSSSDHKHGPRSKSSMTTKLSMLDMKRRVGAIMDFISRTQVDLAAEAPPVPTTNSGQSTPQKTPVPQVNGNSETQSDAADNAAATPDSSNAREFKELNCMEMMDVLTRDMVKWQNQYA